MTSKISFSKMVRREWKQLTWLTAMQAVVYALLIPFRVLLVMSAASGDGVVLSVSERMDLLYRHVGINRFENVLFVLGAGVVCALAAFSYLHSATKLDLYHSLPVKRERLFGAKYLAGVLTFALPYTAAQLLGLAVGALFGAASTALAADILVTCVQHLLFFLCSYAGAAVAVMLTGKMLTTVCAIGVFAGYVPLLYVLKQGLDEAFLVTKLPYFGGVDRNILKHSSPWAFCALWGNGVELSGHAGPTGPWPSMAGLCQLIALAALVTLLAVAIYRIRKTEAAGSALAFRRLESVIKVMIAVPVTMAAALIAHANYHSVVWEAGFILLFGTLACLLMEFIYRWDIRQVLMHKSHIAVTLVLAALFFFTCRYDVFRYNSYLPAMEEIAQMAACGSDVHSHEFPIPGENREYQSFFSDVKASLDYFETDEVETLYALAESGVEIAAERKANQWRWSYRDSETEWVHLKYRLKNGKEVYRYYEVDRKLYQKQMGILLGNEEYREIYFPILTWSPEEVYKISHFYYENSIERLTQEIEAQKQKLSGNQTAEQGEKVPETRRQIEDGADLAMRREAYEAEMVAEQAAYEADVEKADTVAGEELYVPQSRIGEVLEAYQKDLRTLSYEQIEESGPWLNFVRKDQRNTYNYDSYPLNDSFTNTIAVIAEIAAETF